MGIFDRLLGKRKTSGPPMSSTEAMEKVVEIARRTVPPAAELSYSFICSGNQTLIKAFHDLFRVGAPAYGGSAAYYRADDSVLRTRKADPAAGSLLFAGKKTMGSKGEEVAAVADVLASMSGSSFQGLYISFISVGPAGRNWVQTVYSELLGQAARQGILPFYMYTTESKEAAQFLRDSFSLISAA